LALLEQNVIRLIKQLDQSGRHRHKPSQGF
jgi:hypothetical protein